MSGARVCLGCGEFSTDEAAGICRRCGQTLVRRTAFRRVALGAADLEAGPPAAPPEVGEAALDPAKQFDEYVLVEELGKGATGVVHRAWDLEQQRFVALKLLRASFPEDEARFVREGLAVTRLSHPNIVKVHRTGVAQGQRFIAMELVRGRTLTQVIAARAPLKYVLGIFRTVCEAVHYAHGAGVVHRDLKPENILVDAGGHPYVIDFGIARPREPGWTVTLVNEAIGTPEYMAPEQVRGGEASARPSVDVYAMAAVLYQILTGRPPVCGASVYEVMERVEKEPPVPPRSLSPSVPADLETICLRGLEKDPAHRYGSAQELASDVARWLEGEPIHAAPTPGLVRLWRRVWRRSVLVPAAVALLALAVCAWAIAGGVRSRDRLREVLARARALESAGRFEEAGGAYAAALELERGNAEARSGIERASRSRVDMAEATRLLETARPALEQVDRALTDEGADYGELVRRVEEAGRLIEQAVAKAPSMALAHYLQGRAWEILGWWDRAEAGWRRAIELDARFGPAHYRLGRLLLALSYLHGLRFDYDSEDAVLAERTRLAQSASIELQAAVVNGSGLDDELLRRAAEAMLALGQDRMDEAGRIVDGALADFDGRPGAEELHWLRSLTCKGDAQLRALDRAIKLRPWFALARFGRATVRRRSSDPRGAIRDYDVVLQVCPRLPVAYLGRALARRAAGDVEGEVADYDEAIRIDPGFAAAYFNRGCTRRVRGDAAGAVEDFSAAIRLRPHASSYTNRGLALEALGDRDGALANYAQAIAMDPRAVQTYNNRGALRLDIGDLDGALEDLDKALLIDPGYAVGYYTRGAIRERRGDAEGAEADFSRAITLRPRDVGAWMRRGMVRQSRGDFTGAIADYRKALELAPADWSERKRTQKRLDEARRQRGQ